MKEPAEEIKDNFKYFVDQFEDIRVLKYKLPGFDLLHFNKRSLSFIWVKLPSVVVTSSGLRILSII